MPTYQYACTECGHSFEQVQSFSDDALTHCPECDGRLRKVFNAVGVVFKGSGFYRTDSRSSSTASETGSSSTSSSSSSTSASSSTSGGADSSGSGSSSGSTGSSTPSGSGSGGASSTAVAS
ncbi:MAG: FmdB family transcriptional regulator [Nocardioidaceae bacterium]|nr:FmdB family transcriptional regulator [Nocardioidaceae bacterium]